jgi:hypothetical protein
MPTGAQKSRSDRNGVLIRVLAIRPWFFRGLMGHSQAEKAKTH